MHNKENRGEIEIKREKGGRLSTKKKDMHNEREKRVRERIREKEREINKKGRKPPFL